MSFRYEDVEPPAGDDPRDPALYRREAYPIEEKPTLAEAQADERELRDWPRYADGGAL